MKVGIIQSGYIPWRGYFDFINSVDYFIIYDDVQYTNRDWRNRNLIKTHGGLAWLTVPVFHKSRSQLICETKIACDGRWQKKHIDKIKTYYNLTTFYEVIFNKLSEIIFFKFDSISLLNVSLMSWIMKELHITTPIIRSDVLSALGKKTERLIHILEKLGATTYVSGPSAATYLDVNLFAEAGIGLEYKTYDYDPYPQRYPPFEGGVSILDLLFNVGPDAHKHITSKTANTIILASKK